MKAYKILTFILFYKRCKPDKLFQCISTIRKNDRHFMEFLTTPFIKGFTFGVTMAAIPGPIFFLIVQRTLSDGFLTGFFCGLGAVSADALYAFIAAIGLAFVMQFLLTYQTILAFLGSFFLIYLGTTTFLRKLSPYNNTLYDTHLLGAWISTFLLTLANPVTILTYCVIFTALGVNTDHHSITSIIRLISGVITGATAVAFLLTGSLSLFRHKMSYAFLNVINKTAGIILIGFGIVALTHALLTLYKCFFA